MHRHITNSTREDELPTLMQTETLPPLKQKDPSNPSHNPTCNFKNMKNFLGSDPFIHNTFRTNKK